MKQRIWLCAVLGLSCGFGSLLAGCNNSSPEVPKDAFKPAQMTPEAQKGMADAMKKVGPPPKGPNK